MKKSTIFLIILVYIVSFIIVGLFGIQTRAYDEIIDVESISLKVVSGPIVNEKYEEDRNLYTFYTYYDDDLTIQLKAEVLPANATNKAVKINQETKLAAFEVVEDVFVNITVNEGGYGAIEFDVVSTDGKDLEVHARLLVF
ncbi:MAG: hypothetical protein K6E21_00715 [Bacilli bacterium]|nr:hypothetical protein [Bacilli bacterium]